MAKAQIVMGELGGGDSLILKNCSPKTVAGGNTISFTTDGTADLIFMPVMTWGNTYINFDPITGEKLAPNTGAYYSADSGNTWSFDANRSFTVNGNTVSFPSVSSSSLQFALLYTV